MVGIFSRFSGNRNGHRRSQSALEEREVVPPNLEEGAAAITGHGIEVAVEFKPLEHPAEPLDNDQPIQCPLPELSILNDGRIWKERASAGVRRLPDLPVMQQRTPTESDASQAKPWPHTNRVILPSFSAPEHDILKLLGEEYNASGI